MKVRVRYPYWEVGKKQIIEELIEASLWEVLLCLLFKKPVLLFYRKLSPHWNADLPIYLIYCCRHNWTLTYPQGYGETKTCLLCLEEQESKLKEVLSVK